MFTGCRAIDGEVALDEDPGVCLSFLKPLFDLYELGNVRLRRNVMLFLRLKVLGNGPQSPGRNNTFGVVSEQAIDVPNVASICQRIKFHIGISSVQSPGINGNNRDGDVVALDDLFVIIIGKIPSGGPRAVPVLKSMGLLRRSKFNYFEKK